MTLEPSSDIGRSAIASVARAIHTDTSAHSEIRRIYPMRQRVTADIAVK
jgi:hypothetical protein